jgi:hypothetical protein
LRTFCLGLFCCFATSSRWVCRTLWIDWLVLSVDASDAQTRRISLWKQRSNKIHYSNTHTARTFNGKIQNFWSRSKTCIYILKRRTKTHKDTDNFLVTVGMSG